MPQGFLSALFGFEIYVFVPFHFSNGKPFEKCAVLPGTRPTDDREQFFQQSVD